MPTPMASKMPPGPIPTPNNLKPPTRPTTPPMGGMPDVAPMAKSLMGVADASGPNDIIEIKLSMTRAEAEKVVQTLNENGLGMIAQEFEKAIAPPPGQPDNNTPEALQNDIVAMQPRNM